MQARPVSCGPSKKDQHAGMKTDSDYATVHVRPSRVRWRKMTVPCAPLPACNRLRSDEIHRTIHPCDGRDPGPFTGLMNRNRFFAWWNAILEVKQYLWDARQIWRTSNNALGPTL